jgi:hypothetical protein
VSGGAGGAAPTPPPPPTTAPASWRLTLPCLGITWGGLVGDRGHRGRANCACWAALPRTTPRNPCPGGHRGGEGSPRTRFFCESPLIHTWGYSNRPVGPQPGPIGKIPANYTRYAIRDTRYTREASMFLITTPFAPLALHMGLIYPLRGPLLGPSTRGTQLHCVLRSDSEFPRQARSIELLDTTRYTRASESRVG